MSEANINLKKRAPKPKVVITNTKLDAEVKKLTSDSSKKEISTHISSSQVEIEGETTKEEQIYTAMSQVKKEKNSEIVEKVISPDSKQKNGLILDVKNHGLSTIFEPISKTTIKAGRTAQIECLSPTVKQAVVNNLNQFNELGKKVEVLSNE
ncbi:MAG: hypothetical protein BGO19_13995 [Acinetobacter sp. 38-8]|nr:MAG: hypothetical protein BGO19_13995 [Acinetobacter sp. 38-8]